MKKVLVTLFILFIVSFAHAQDTTLNEYAGTYKFPEGSFVTSAEITLSNNILSVNSSQGSSPLERKAKDTFALTNYEGGMAYFFRNTNGKVDRIKVEVQDVLLEGSKDNVTAWMNRRNYLTIRKQIPVK